MQKIKDELESILVTLRDRVILGVEIPNAQHRVLIGRGGQHLNEVQDKFNVQIQFPGSRSYAQVGEPENAGDLEAVDATNLVKVSGPRAGCEQAITQLKVCYEHANFLLEVVLTGVAEQCQGRRSRYRVQHRPSPSEVLQRHLSAGHLLQDAQELQRHRR